MNGLLKKNEQRQLQLIEIVSGHTEGISISNVADFLDYSERTISLDIIAIQKKFPFLCLKVINHAIKMDIAPNYNLTYVYQYMFKDNAGIRMLERLFLYKQTNLENLTALLQLSQATIYQLIEQVNEVISNKYGVLIATNPFQLKGDEDKIRAFFSQLYSSIYTQLEWPFINSDESAITEFITKVTDSIHFPLNYIGINYMKTLVAVNLVRLKQGYTLAVDSEKAILIYQTLQSTNFMNDKTKKIMNRLGIPFNHHTLEQLFYVFINADYIIPNSQFTNRSKNIDRRIESFNNLNYVIETLKNEFGLTFGNPGPVLLGLHNAAMLNRQDIDSENIFFESKAEFIKELTGHFPAFISRASYLFEEYCIKMMMEGDQLLINRLIHHLFIQWKTLYTQLVENERIIEASIICHYDVDHVSFLKEYFEVHFGKKIRFNIYDASQLSLAHLRKIPEPILLSTFHIPLIEGKHIININFFPSSKDLDKLYSVLKKMSASQ